MSKNSPSRAKDATYRITGAITRAANGAPLEGLTVKAFDKDFFREQPLGEAVTDEVGRYEILFDRDAFTGPLVILERSPDIFLQIYDREGRLLETTERNVVVNAGTDTRIDVSLRSPEPSYEQKELSYIAGEPVDLAAAARLTSQDLIAIYRYLRGRTVKLDRPDLVRQAFPGSFNGRQPWDDCGEGHLDAIRFLLKERGNFDFDESDFDDLPPGATVKVFFTANIRVKYTTDAGFPADAVDPTLPASDTELFLSDGVTSLGFIRANLADLDPTNTEVAPIYVQKVGLIAEHAISRYVGPVFSMRDPRNGLPRMEYRILQQPAGVFGQTQAGWSHVEVRPNNSDLQNFGTVPHELFHQVQYRYNNTPGASRFGIYDVLREGGARFIEDSVNDAPNRYALQSQQIFNDPTISLINPGVGLLNPIRYAAGLFWKYVAEQHSTNTAAADEPAVGMDTYRKVLEASANVLGTDPGVGYEPTTLRDARANMPWYGRFDQFSYYDAASTELSSHETTWGNYLLANYLHGTANPVGDRRFEYMEDEDAITWPPDGLAAVAKLAELQAAVAPGDDLTLAQGGSFSINVMGQKAFAAKYYRITPGGSPAPRMLRIRLTTSGGMTDPLIQILRLGAGSSLIDISRSDQATYSKTINMAGLQEVVVIVASRVNPGNFTVQFDEVASDTDCMVTRWNSAVATEYEIDPRGWAWSWVSPDVMVDTDDDLVADTQVVFGVNNKLKVRIRNRGNAPANNIQVDFWYQKATPYLTAAGWIPVQDAAMPPVTQVITGESLAAAGNPGDEKWVTVNWAPVDDGTHHHHWCIKARITVPGDPNSDNKLVLSNFSNVVVDADSDSDSLVQLIRHAEGRQAHEFHVIPRGPKWTLVQQEIIGDELATDYQTDDHCVCRPKAVAPIPTRVSFARLQVTAANAIRRWDGYERQNKPDPEAFYPLNRAALPPGVDPEELVTLAHVINGEVIGGVTYRIVKKR